MFENPFSFSGRIRRTEYGLWLLFADSEPGFNRFGLNPKEILKQ
jgi:uncharacterized membrane protein YhaH (DUF805 family)